MDARMRLIIQAASLISVIQAWVMFMHQRAVRRAGRPLILYGPLFPREQERIQNLNYIYNCNDVEALWMLRMKRVPFARLVETFRSRGLLQDSINTSVEEQVAMFLHVVGHNQRFRVIHNTFRRSMETISRYFKQVLFVVGELRGEMIRRPSGQTPPKIRGSPRWYPYFKELFNLRHSSLRVTVERAFGALKNRFKILDQKPFHPYSTQVKLVLACCILHNWILQWGFDEHMPEEEDVEPDDVVSSSHGVEAFDNEAWKNKRLEWAEAMWLNRGQCRI
ncbi:hypothetical protein VPH35_128047 [Triticum aestivum]